MDDILIVTVGGAPKLVTTDRSFAQYVVQTMERGVEHEPIVVTTLKRHPEEIYEDTWC